MRDNTLSRRTVVYAILLVAVFLLLAVVVSGCRTTQERYVVSANYLKLGPDDGYEGETVRDTGKRITCYFYRYWCSICVGGRCTHGRGALFTDGGIYYKGDFRHGVMHGTGDYDDDDIGYIGGFRHGVPDGPGTLTYLDGTRYKGNFSGGRLVGQFRVTTKGGTTKSMSFSGKDALSGPVMGRGTREVKRGNTYWTGPCRTG